jgi:hypothetical protein
LKGVGVQVIYGDGSPDAPTNQRTNTLTIDMMNGSPFIDFTKSGPAPADIWLTPYGGSNQIWGRDVNNAPNDPKLPPNVTGVTSAFTWTDASGVSHQNISIYLVIASAGTWTLAPSYNPKPDQPQLFQNTGIGTGQMVVVLLPHMVGQTPFAALPAADQVAIATMMMSTAFNFPANTPGASQVSNPTAHQEVYDGQTVTFGYNQVVSQLMTKYSVTTANSKPT